MFRLSLLVLVAITAAAAAYPDEKRLTVEVDRCTTIAVGKKAGTEGIFGRFAVSNAENLTYV
jgi:hypothetical protein